MRGIGGRGFGCGGGSFSGGFPGTPKYALRFFRPCRPCRSSHIRRLKPEANSRRPKRRRKRRASGLPALSCCLQRNLGEWTPAWAFPLLSLRCFLVFLCLYAHFVVGSVTVVVLTAFQVSGRRRWGRHSKNTADRHRGGCGHRERCQGEPRREEGTRRLHGWSEFILSRLFLILFSTLT